MTNIAILAAGPPKPNHINPGAPRNRHLEKINDMVVIDHVINNSRIPNTKLYVVIDPKNIDLINHVKKQENITILFPKDGKIYSTLEVALEPVGDTILVMGDLINLKEGDIKKFIDSPYKSATCVYEQPWGHHIPSSVPTLIRRGNCGDCITKVAQEHKEEYLSSDLQSMCRWFWKQFHPHSQINEYIQNDIGTFTSFTFFKEIWSNPECNEFGDKGAIKFNHQVYLDND